MLSPVLGFAPMRVCPRCDHRSGDDGVFCPEDGARLVPDDGSETAAPGDPRVGMVVAERYRILRRIGEGGMGVVYEAEHIVLGKHVAIKVLRDDFARKSDLVERFKQEARSASIIGHENIIDVSDFGEMPGGGIFFAMELLRGEDLADVLKRERRLPLRRAVHIVSQVCRALHAAHQKGIIHRDLKPENVFLVHKDDRRDVVKVLDFGIAKMTTLDAEGRRLTQTGVIFGTPEYMSPEQARGQTLDLRVDVYAAGVMLYEMLAGCAPFGGDSFMAVLTKHMFEQPPPMAEAAPDVATPPAVEAVVMKAMAKDRDQRYSTMLEMLEDLRAVAGERPDPARASTVPEADASAGARAGAIPAGTSTRSLRPVAGAARTGRSFLPRAAMGMLAVALAAAAATGAYLAVRDVPQDEAPAAAARTADAGTSLRVVRIIRDATTAPDLPAAAPDAGAEAVAAADAGDEPPADAGTTEATGEEAGSADADVRKVALRIVTPLEGAKVFDSRGTVGCEPTPCTILAIPGTEIRLRVRKGQWSGERTIRVPSTPRDVLIDLRREASPPPPPPVDAGSPVAQRDTWALRVPDALAP